MRVAIIAALLLIIPFAGCIDNGPICCDFSMYVQGEKSKDLDELHIIVSKVTMHYAGSDSVVSSGPQEFSRDMDLDLRIDQAHGKLAIFAGEANIPAGEYEGITVELAGAYGIKDGVRVNVALIDQILHYALSLIQEEQLETRAVLDIDGKISKNQGSYTFEHSAGAILVNKVNDRESGAEVHSVGQLVALSEL